MRTGTYDGVESFVLEPGTYVDFGGISAKDHHLYSCVGVGVDKSQLKPLHFFFIVIHQTDLQSFHFRRVVA